MAKNTPTKPRQVILGKLRTLHFANEAARRAAGDAELLGRDGLYKTQRGTLVPIFRVVNTLIATTIYEPKQASAPRAPLSPLRFGLARNRNDFAGFVADAAQVAPRGFRQPSVKAKKWFSTSLVEQAAVAAGHMEAPRPERSKRGEQKLAAHLAMNAAIAGERVNGIAPKYLSAHARRRLAASDLHLAAE